MGLQLTEMENDPVVKQTLKAYHGALTGGRGGDDIGDMIPPVEEMPGVKALVKADALDSVSAAILAVGPLTRIISVDDIEDQLDPRVADTLRVMNGPVEDGPGSLLVSGNPFVLKILVATVAGATAKDELTEMISGMYQEDQRAAVGDLSEFIVVLGEHMMETQRLAEIPPKLMDQFIEGIDNLAGVARDRMHKRVLADIGRELKAEVTKAAAAEITAAAPAPAIDPDSPFELLKKNARKFKPGGMNG